MYKFNAEELPWIGFCMLNDDVPDKLLAMDIYRRHIKKVIEENESGMDPDIQELLSLGGDDSSQEGDKLCPVTIMALHKSIEILDSISGYLK